MRLWDQVKALEGKVLRTLDQNKPFEVKDVTVNQIKLKVSTGKIRSFQRKEVEGAFRELVQRGEISRIEIHERHSQRNPAYTAAILAQLEGVTHQVSPIRLFYGAGRPV